MTRKCPFKFQYPLTVTANCEHNLSISSIMTYTLPIGDVDFYPFKDGKQPSCPS